MSVSDKIEQELREVLTSIVGKGYNLTVHPDGKDVIEYSQDVDAIVAATLQDSFQPIQVHSSRTLIGTFVVDMEMAALGERLVSSHTRSIAHLFE